MKKLVEKQKQLMEYVPHDIRPDAFVKMAAGMKLMDTLLRFMNSTGHKPWRPNPLPAGTQQILLADLKKCVSALAYLHRTNAGHDMEFDSLKVQSRQIVSTYGIIEEAIEHFNSLGIGTRDEQLEELTDVLFFFLEQMILGGFTWADVEQQYYRKWGVNMERYTKAKKGDYGWDKRNKEKL